MVETEPSPTTLSNQPRGRERFNLRLALLVGVFTLAVFLTGVELFNHHMHLDTAPVTVQVVIRGLEISVGLSLAIINGSLAGLSAKNSLPSGNK